MGTAGDRLEEKNIERRKKAWEKQKAQEEWEKSAYYTESGYKTKAEYDWYQSQAAGSYVGERKEYIPKAANGLWGAYKTLPAHLQKYTNTRYWDGSAWVTDLPNIPMTELKPAYNDTSKPGISGSIPDSSFQGGTTDVSGEESFTTTGSNSIAGKLGIGDISSPSRKRGKGMSAALGVM